MKKFRLLWLVLWLIPTAIIYAQGAPEPINDALADLSNRVGRQVSISDLDNWFWRQETFPDTSLGCPQDGQVYTQVVTAGYVFELTYAGTVYDYRVSADRSTVFLCSTRDANAPTPTPSTEEVLAQSNPLCPLPEAGEPAFMRTRVTTGIQARVTPGAPNNLRSEPLSTASVVGQIPPGGIFEIMAGPACDDGIIWWQVNFDGVIGWTAEGQGGEFWIEPLPPTALSPAPLITVDNAPQIVEVARLQGNFVPQLAFSPDGGTLATLGALGSTGVWLYPMTALDTTPRILASDDRFIALDYSRDGSRLLLGGFDGTARLWNLAPTAPLREPLFLNSHQELARSVAFNPTGTQFAVAGSIAFTNANVNRENAILLWDIETVSIAAIFSGHADTVHEIAFSPSGTQLASVSDDGTLRIWDTASGSALQVIEVGIPLRTVTYRFDGAVLLVGDTNGTITLLDAILGTTYGTYSGHTGAINTLAFSPDGTLFASGSDDGTIAIWDGLQPGISIATLTAHFASVRDVTFSPDGIRLASAADDNTIRIWGVRTP